MADLVEELGPGVRPGALGQKSGAGGGRGEASEGEGGLLPDALQHLLQGPGVDPVLRQQGTKVIPVSSRARRRMRMSQWPPPLPSCPPRHLPSWPGSKGLVPGGLKASGAG